LNKIEIIGNAVVLDNLRSAYNVGSIYRTAFSFGFNTIIHVGITPKRDNPSFASASRGVEENIKTIYVPSINDAETILRKCNYSIYALEISANSTKLNEIILNNPFALILGNEAMGVSMSAMEMSDSVIEIETTGSKDSLNVSVAFGIFAYTVFIKNNL